MTTMPKPVVPSSTASVTRPPSATDGERVLLTGIRWETYEMLGEDLRDWPIRMTYDRGDLEIMTLSPGHEIYKTLIGRFIETLTLELRIRIKSLGSTTWKRKELQRGLESDECYYIANEPRVRGKTELDFASDPPPDLAVEIDVSRSSARRMGIHAALRIPEVWSFDGEDLRVHRLQADGTYAPAEQSLSFPFLPVAELARFVRQIATVDETTLLLAFRDWVRADVLPRMQAAQPGPNGG